jgi:hypothetical protein
VADRNDTLESALDVCVYGPIGMALYARDTVPGFMRAFAARGRAEVSKKTGRVSEQANQARSVGQLAITYGVPEVRRRATGLWTIVEQVVITRINPRSPSEAPTTDEAFAPAPPPTTPGDVASGPRPRLAIPDYDELSASQVVDRLDGLGTEELAQVRAYEAQNRGRRTILGKIDQLAGR